MANVVDSLNAIRQVVFEEKKVTLSQLAEALRADFQGYEDLQRELSDHAPKFGNDQDDADDCMNDMVAAFAQMVDGYRQSPGRQVPAGPLLRGGPRQDGPAHRRDAGWPQRPGGPGQRPQPRSGQGQG